MVWRFAKQAKKLQERSLSTQDCLNYCRNGLKTNLCAFNMGYHLVHLLNLTHIYTIILLVFKAGVLKLLKPGHA